MRELPLRRFGVPEKWRRARYCWLATPAEISSLDKPSGQTGMLSEAVKGSNIQIETSQRLGTLYEEIVKFAKENEVDLIVIATHGYTGLKHFLLGSTANG